MTENQIPTIETARLRMRPLATADLDDYAHFIFADPDVMRYLPQRAGTPHERATRAMAFFNDHWTQHGYGVWAIVDKISGHFIGDCGLNYLADIDEVEILYAFRQAAWGQGFATEAARASAQFAFQEIGLTRLVAFAVPANIASRRVMEHLGFAYEKDTHLFGLDLVQYALARDRFHKAPASSV